MLLITSAILMLLSQIGSDLSDGTRLVYSSGGAAQDPWIYDSVRVLVREGFDRCVVVARRGQAARESCARGDTLFERPTTGAHAAVRPLGPDMTLDVRMPNGNVARYVTERPSVARVQAQSIEYVPTTVTTRNADGRVIRRLREHYAPTLLTALWGVFEEPDAAGGWRTVREFSLSEIHRPEPPPSPVEAIRRASVNGNHDEAIALADALVARTPHSPSAVYVRAVALARAGRDAAAADAVRTLLAWDARFAQQTLADSAFARVRELFRDVDVDALAERARQPIARGAVWAVLEERDLVVEGTAWDPTTRSVLVGSLNKNKIVAIAPDGTVSDRVAPRAHGLGSVVGIHVDTLRGILWVASTARFDTPTDTTVPALFAFDAATGAFRRRIDAPSRSAFLNDITTAPDGTVYVTDSRGPSVLQLRPGADALELFTATGSLPAVNGITLSADGAHLFVSALDHIRVVSLADGASWRLAVPDSINVAGIDGLAFTADALIAHHPLAFWRVARYELDPGHRRVVGVRFIERNTPDVRTSTTGEVVGDTYYYIGNSQIDRMNQGTLDSATMQPIRMYRAALQPAEEEVVAVALADTDSVVLLHAHTLDRVATLPVGREPHEVAASADGRRLFVANARGNGITVINVSPAPRVHATWRLPDDVSAHDVAIGDGGVLWAVSGEPSLLLGLDTVSGAVRYRHSLQRAGSWMVDSRGPGGALIVAHLEGGAVALVEPGNGRQRLFEGAEGEIDAAASADLTEVWSVNVTTGDLTVFSSGSGERLQRAFSGAGASRIAFTPDGRHAIVVHSGDSTVAAYDVRTRQRIASATVARGPKVIAISRDGRRAYVTHPHGALSVIDLPSMTVLRSIAIPGRPDGVAIGATPPQ